MDVCVCGVRARAVLAVFHPNAILAFIFRLPYRKWILRLSHKVKHTKNMSVFFQMSEHSPHVTITGGFLNAKILETSFSYM